MIVLGIESSCDETAAAVIHKDGEVLSNIISSQVALHAPYGGVVPELAARAHMEAITEVIAQAVLCLPNQLDDVDAIAVTQGPGLVGALLVGMQAAKAIAWALNKPLVGVNHLDGHLLAPRLKWKEDINHVPEFPYIALLASGGHTAIYHVHSAVHNHLIAQTRDDAAGEAFDKAAKLLGLGYPGGPVVDKLAAQGDASVMSFPTPMAGQKNLEFSFSGLKTSVARLVEQKGIPKDRELNDICAAFQSVVVESLVEKSIAACKLEKMTRLAFTGGVAANRGLRALAQKRCEEEKLELFLPSLKACTDNAAMIAYAGMEKIHAQGPDQLSLQVYSRDPSRKRGKFTSDGKLIKRASM